MLTSEKTLTVGVVGFTIGALRMATLLQAAKNLNIQLNIAYVLGGRLEKTREAVQKFMTDHQVAIEVCGGLDHRSQYEELIRKPVDFIMVAVPHDQHNLILELIKNARRDGDGPKHIFWSAPFCMINDDLVAWLEQQTATGLIFEAGFHSFYSSLLEQVRDKMQQLGQINNIKVTGHYLPREGSFYLSQEQSGGMGVTHKSYVEAMLFKLLNSFPSEICSDGLNAKQCVAAKNIHLNTDLEFVYQIDQLKFKFPEGQTLAKVKCSYTKNEPFAILINGRHGDIEVSLPPDGSGAFTVYLNNREPEHFKQEDDPLVKQAQAFLTAMTKGIDADNNRNNLQQAIRQNKIQEDADESARKEQRPGSQPESPFYKTRLASPHPGAVSSPPLP